MPGRGETLTPADRADAREEVAAEDRGGAFRARPYATPKKTRKLLVIESLHGMSHNTIPHTNVMLERLGKITGAWETEFNNDLEQSASIRRSRTTTASSSTASSASSLAGSGGARRAGAVRARRRRPGRHPRHAVGVAQLGRVRRDDRRAERAAPHRAGRHEGLRSGEPADEAVRGQGSELQGGVLPLRASRAGPPALGQGPRADDRRARRSERSSRSRGPATSGRTISIP